MTLTELVAEALIWHKRPDQEAATRSALRRCLLKYHRRHKFFKDLVGPVTAPNTTPLQSTAIIDLTAAPFVRLRQVASVQITGRNYCAPTTADDVLDNDGYNRENVYLIAGTNLNIAALAGFSSADIVYYQDPSTDPTSGFSDWICTDYPDLLAAGAAAMVLSGDNEGELYKGAKQEELEQWTTLVANNLEPEAR